MKAKRRQMPLLAAVAALAVAAAAPLAKHVVFIVADDLGHADVPLTNAACDLVTPRLSALAAGGVRLGSFYVQPLCTPSRSVFMSGRLPVHTGLQHGVIADSVPNGLPLNETTLPQVLRGAGFRTHMVGKW